MKKFSFLAAFVVALGAIGLSACLETGKTYCEVSASPTDCFDGYKCIASKSGSNEGQCYQPCGTPDTVSKCAYGYTCSLKRVIVEGDDSDEQYCVPNDSSSDK